MHKKRIIFMGSPTIASEYLTLLLKNNFNIIGVYTQPPRPKGRGLKTTKSEVHNNAQKCNIPISHPENFLDKQTIDNFIALKPDLVIVMAYGILLPENILNIPKFGFINIHISLLPRWRGASPVEYTLLNGDKETGVTIFKLTDKLDSGPIINQNKIKIDNDSNKEEIFIKLNNLGKKMLIKTLPVYFSNKIILKEQNEKNSTYAPKISAAITKINFNQSIEDVFNQIKAFAPKPGAWFYFKNERIKIIFCKKINTDSKPSLITNNNFHIGCNDGEIVPLIIQREGKKPLKIHDFLRGFNFSIGEKVNEQI